MGSHPGRGAARLRWLDPATVYSLSLALIAAVYIGFAVADGRPRIVATDPGEEQSVNAALADRERRASDEHQADDECDEPAAAPAPGEGGMGLRLARRMCDDVTIRRGASGSTVILRMRLPGQDAPGPAVDPLPRATRGDRGHLVRRHQPWPGDGSLPHRRALQSGMMFSFTVARDQGAGRMIVLRRGDEGPPAGGQLGG